jgi:MFS transporter, DHA2 family, multidrug resistance protein
MTMTGSDGFKRIALTVCVMMATIMQALDTTIANVALPYMQGSLATTQDQVSWVLTSYIVAAAIMTAPLGWMSMRFGRKKLFIVCAAGFTIASMLCGIAQSIEEMVLFRLLQGIFGAALVPLSQAVMLDAYPIEQRGQAMAIWGMGVMLGPIMGPTLGGWLTEVLSWRWVFFVNLPFGILTVLGLSAIMDETAARKDVPFDWLGFLALSTAIGSLQLMLDRGEQVGWFDSSEIVIEAAISIAGLYIFLAHALTIPRPFIPLAVFTDWNFSVALLLMFVVGIILLASMALITPYIQNVMGYPIMAAGELLGARGIGTLVAMMVVGRLLNSFDARPLVLIGLLLSLWSIWQSVYFSPETSALWIVETSIAQGFGLGFIFVPLNSAAFATLPAALRTDGVALWTLIRNLGSSIGVSIVISQLVSGTTLYRTRIAETVSPFGLGIPLSGASDMLDPSTTLGQGMLEGLVMREAGLISYMNDYLLMFFVTLFALPLVLLLKKPDGQPVAPAPAAHAD